MQDHNKTRATLRPTDDKASSSQAVRALGTGTENPKNRLLAIGWIGHQSSSAESAARIGAAQLGCTSGVGVVYRRSGERIGSPAADATALRNCHKGSCLTNSGLFCIGPRGGGGSGLLYCGVSCAKQASALPSQDGRSTPTTPAQFGLVLCANSAEL